MVKTRTDERERVFSLCRTADRPGLPAFIAGAVERLLGLEYMGREYLKIPDLDDPSRFLEEVFDRLDVRIEVSESELLRVPRKGPTIVVANHPFGGIDGMAAAVVLRSLRPDVKVLANAMLGRIPEMADLFFLVDIFGGQDAARRNVAVLRQAKRWLADGGMMVIFPAGEVAHFNLRDRRVVESPWDPAVGRMIRDAGCTVVPIWFGGSNGPLLQIASLIHPLLRTALLPRALLARRGEPLMMRIGGPIAYKRLAECRDNSEMMAYLRGRTLILAAGQNPERRSTAEPVQPRRTPADPRPVADAVEPGLLETEITALPDRQLLVDAGAQRVYVAEAAQIPNTLHEIGRLRELSFRAVGEGTGREVDLDRFDHDYKHLFIWRPRRREIVGAYRLGLTDRLLAAHGVDGLYTSTLFRYDPRLLEVMGPALELGRSFIRPEYQRSYSSLLLLWKGIGRFVAAHPRYPILFGPVSISADYRSASQELIAVFLKQNAFHHPWSRWVRPHTEFRPRRTHDVRLAADELRNLDDVSAFISDIEGDGKGMPILLRQYLKTGGQLLGFNVDPDFANVLDVLIMVDLRQTPRHTLMRYLGGDGTKAFFAHHQKPDG